MQEVSLLRRSSRRCLVSVLSAGLNDPLGGIDQEFVGLDQVLKQPFDGPDSDGLGFHGIGLIH